MEDLNQTDYKCYDFVRCSGCFVWRRQVANSEVIRVLVFAMALSYGTKDFIEGGVITAVIVLNVTIGFWQEYGA